MRSVSMQEIIRRIEMANDTKYGRLYPERAVAPLVEAANHIIDAITGRPSTESERDLMEALETLNDEGFPPDEPLFLLRGQDMLAAEAVRYYAELIDVPGVGIDASHIRAYAEWMAAWQPRKLPD